MNRYRPTPPYTRRVWTPQNFMTAGFILGCIAAAIGFGLAALIYG